MKNLINFIQKYLLFVSPIVLTTIIWSSFQSDSEMSQSGSLVKIILWEVMSWALILWFIFLSIFMCLLAAKRDVQDSALKYVAGLRERDEREEVIMGLAARKTFSATSGFLVLLLFLSCFTLRIAKLPPDLVVNGKQHSLSLGFQLTGDEKKTDRSPDGLVIYEYHHLPLSQSALILIILLWQLAVFRATARSEFRRGGI
jgi:hypothetical protein